MPFVRILVADDHSVTRRGVRALLETKDGWRVCGEAATGSEAILKAKKLKPHVVVMDISMPEVDGLEATRQIHAEMPDVAVLMLTMHDSERVVRDVLAAGARGYVLKSDVDRNLILAIEALQRGKSFFSAKVTEIVVDGYLKNKPARPRATASTATELTPRQKEIVQHLAEGKANKEVAAALGISTKTVEAHRAEIMRKLQLNSFSDLIRYAVRERIVGL
jgi:DNA-binding NarL/FixJ family response regulator